MSYWDQPDATRTVRLFAMLLLLDRADQALTKGSRTPEDPAQAEGGRLSGRPPAPAPCPQDDTRTPVLCELAELLNRDTGNTATGAELRRIAEILELLDRDHLARCWWIRAAHMGDEDAKDYLEVLELEEAPEFLERHCGSSELRETAMRKTREELHGIIPPDWESMVRGSLAVHMTPGTPLLLPHAGKEEITGKVQSMLREIEEYLANPDHLTDGRRL